MSAKRVPRLPSLRHHLALRGDAVSLAMGLANAASPSSVEMEVRMPPWDEWMSGRVEF